MLRENAIKNKLTGASSINVLDTYHTQKKLGFNRGDALPESTMPL